MEKRYQVFFVIVIGYMLIQILRGSLGGVAVVIPALLLVGLGAVVFGVRHDRTAR
jgi:hypothetical protein